MATGAAQTIILAGAPESASVDWSSVQLLTSFDAAIARFAGLAPDSDSASHSHISGHDRHRVSADTTTTTSTTTTSTPGHAQWRVLGLERAYIHTGFSQPVAAFRLPLEASTSFRRDFSARQLRIHGHHASAFSTSFVGPNSLGAGQTGDDDDDDGGDDDGNPAALAEALTQFYQHSLEHHAEVRSSQLVLTGDDGGSGGGGVDEARASQSDFLSMLSSSSSSLSSSPPSSQPRPPSSPSPSPSLPHTSLSPSLSPSSPSQSQSQSPSPSLSPSQSSPSRRAAKPPLDISANGRNNRITDLAALPTAAHLDAAQPQTLTVNLVVGVVSVSAPRPVRTRWGALRELVEVVVGDDTSCGLAVTFWLPPSPPPWRARNANANGNGDDATAPLLGGLRPQDTALMRNVALRAFRGRVYGSSLPRGLTRVHVLCRTRLGAADAPGYYGPADLAAAARGGVHTHAQLEKARRVRQWVVSFVGRDHVFGEGRGQGQGGGGRGRPPARRRRTEWDVMPLLDTPT